MATDKIQTGLRLSESTYKKVKILAAAEHRSFNNFVEHIVQKYISDYEKQHGLIEISDED